MEMIDDPRNFDMTIPAQHTVTGGAPSLVVAPEPDAREARVARLEAIIAHHERKLKRIRLHAQRGMGSVTIAEAGQRFQYIDSIATDALLDGPGDCETLYDEL
jgi:hypothetical protein